MGLPSATLPPVKKGSFIARADGDYDLPRGMVVALLGVSPPTLDSWSTAADPPPRNADGTYPAKALGDWIRKKQTVRRTQGGYKWLPSGVVMVDKDGLETLDQAKARREREAADALEMKNEIARGELIRVDDVQQAWSNVLGKVRTRLLRIPTSAATLVTGLTDPAQAQSVLSDAVNDALLELSVAEDE